MTSLIRVSDVDTLIYTIHAYLIKPIPAPVLIFAFTSVS